ncbi:MAG: twin-arginine translocation signal domain-containing protein [Gammaproteobacteria bacterium]
MSRKSVDPKSRREFLRGLAVAGGATAMVAVAGRSYAAPVEVKAPAKPAAKGYHETPHIRTYYDKARI